jgi:hypothetical protein
MPKQKRAGGRPKKNWMEGIRKVMNERNLNDDKVSKKSLFYLKVFRLCRLLFKEYSKNKHEHEVLVECY